MERRDSKSKDRPCLLRPVQQGEALRNKAGAMDYRGSSLAEGEGVRVCQQYSCVTIDPSGTKPISTVFPPPPRTNGPVACRKDWIQYIYYYCSCFRNSYVVRRECNVLAISYYTSCRKPKPRGDYVEFAPPPGGVGEVTPRPVPSPFPGPPVFSKPPEPSLCPTPIGDYEISPIGQSFANDCVSKARQDAPGEGTIGYLVIVIELCHRCCRAVLPKYAGECHRSCQILGIGHPDHVNATFGDMVVSPPSPGAGYGAPVIGRPVPPIYVR